MSVLISALILASSAVECPSYIEDTQSLYKPVSGWEVLVGNQQKRLQAATVYIGHPNERASLQPVKIKSGGWSWTQLPSNAWLECEYVASSIRLIRPLAENDYCVFQDGDAGTNKPPSMKCTHRSDRRK